MTKDEKIKLLCDNIAFRERDVVERQMEIDGHRLSLEIIERDYTDNPDIVAYKPYLEELLRTAILEQTKVKIFLEAAQVNLARIRD